MPAQLILAFALALLWNAATIINARLALWADLTYRRRLRLARARLPSLTAATLADAFAETAARLGEKPCAICSHTSRSFSFSTVERESNRVARWALEVLVRPRSEAGAETGPPVVALLLDSSPELLTVVLGLAKAGCAVALLDLERFRVQYCAEAPASLVGALRACGAHSLLFGGRFSEEVRRAAAQLEEAGIGLHAWPDSESGESAVHSWATAAGVALARAGVAPLDRLGARAKLTANSACLLVEQTTFGLDPSPSPLPSRATWHTLTHATLLQMASGCVASAGLLELDVLYSAVALERAHNCALLLGATLLGCTTVVCATFSPASFFADCDELGCSAALHEGSMLALLAAQPESPLEWQHSLRLLLGPSVGPPLAMVCQTRFRLRELTSAFARPAGGGCALVLGAQVRRPTAAAVGAIGCVGWLRAREKTLFLAQPDPRTGLPARAAAGEAEGRCVPCARGQAGLLLARADSAALATQLGFEAVRGVCAAGDAYVRTGEVARHDRFGGWVRVVGLAGERTAVGTLEAARALAGAGGVLDACAFAASLPGPPPTGKAGSERRVCVVAVSTADGAAPDLRALAAALVAGVPKGARAPLLLRAVGSLEYSTRGCAPRTAALAARSLAPPADRAGGGCNGASTPSLWWWDDGIGAQCFRPLNDVDFARVASGELRIGGES
ncbi:hypothetical protein T492DRAFT_296206 [Pavlovales sp. CCMP2436]|nr:hypothetical protein T492DRAFT_296206 [Pavlovales sp. CCMP2436]